ncbi:hypothetical protein GCM10025864_05760 [Luteimicrobium album]|uniref:Uncharacterized protein n=1 Tax=Luteimicrobium album TaxID=1054550 RepID=A0ABQ6HXX0_9MICO|nr:hypothetical protein [Luteimicrobium album]GMA22817.1 hypothetical protein GCM10025864_05760 [Luteimicrobium album]
MDDEPLLLPSALWHGVREEDLLHAYAMPVAVLTQPDGMVMFLGPGRTGTDLIEVGVIEWFGMTAIAHGMRPARDKYLRAGGLG